MRIGHDENFLSIEKYVLDSPHSGWRFEAGACLGGRRFTAFHDSVVLDESVQTRQGFKKFANFESHCIEILLSEGGWLRIERDHRGYLTIRYRLAGWKVSAAMEGEVMVEGEFANIFCHEFGALLKLAIDLFTDEKSRPFSA